MNTLNNKRLKDFAWIYKHISPKVALSALCSQYGSEGKKLFKQLKAYVKQNPAIEDM